jgi:hypothetical protein
MANPPAVGLACPLSCPGCGALVHEVTPREGQVWLTCTADLRGRPGSGVSPASSLRAPCGTHWLNITVPGNVPPVDALSARYGSQIAEALAEAGGEAFRRVFPSSMAHPVVHVQVLTLKRVEHVFRFLTLSGILRVVRVMPPEEEAPAALG